MKTHIRIALVLAMFFCWFFVTGFVISKSTRRYCWKKSFFTVSGVFSWLVGCVLGWPDYIRLTGNTMLYLIAAFLIYKGPLKALSNDDSPKKTD
jgi:hypothetical protein